jgi:hypothetical protein
MPALLVLRHMLLKSMCTAAAALRSRVLTIFEEHAPCERLVEEQPHHVHIIWEVLEILQYLRNYQPTLLWY